MRAFVRALNGNVTAKCIISAKQNSEDKGADNSGKHCELQCMQPHGLFLASDSLPKKIGVDLGVYVHHYISS